MLQSTMSCWHPPCHVGIHHAMLASTMPYCNPACHVAIHHVILVYAPQPASSMQGYSELRATRKTCCEAVAPQAVQLLHSCAAFAKAMQRWQTIDAPPASSSTRAWCEPHQPIPVVKVQTRRRGPEPRTVSQAQGSNGWTVASAV
jgi:hypothetical protein